MIVLIIVLQMKFHTVCTAFMTVVTQSQTVSSGQGNQSQTWLTTVVIVVMIELTQLHIVVTICWIIGMTSVTSIVRGRSRVWQIIWYVGAEGYTAEKIICRAVSVTRLVLRRSWVNVLFASVLQLVRPFCFGQSLWFVGRRFISGRLGGCFVFLGS